MLYYSIGGFSIVRTRDEAERLVADRCRTPDYKLWDAEGDAAKMRQLKSEEAELLAVRIAEIKTVEIDAEPICQAGGLGTWSLWSDSNFRPFTIRVLELYAPEAPSKVRPFLTDKTDLSIPCLISQQAKKFIDASRGSDSLTPKWLGRIRDVLEEKEIQIGGDRGVWARRTITKYRLKLDTEEKVVFVFTVGYFEGYAFDVCDSWGEAKEAFNPPPCPLTECLECGAVFERPGNVEWGGMGCRRCNS